MTGTGWGLGGGGESKRGRWGGGGGYKETSLDISMVVCNVGLQCNYPVFSASSGQPRKRRARPEDRRRAGSPFVTRSDN